MNHRVKSITGTSGSTGISEVMEGTLRLLNIAPDQTEVIPHRVRLAEIASREEERTSEPLLSAEYKP